MTPLQKANPHLIGKKFDGYAKQVERECSILFKRVPSEYYLDIPYYNWMPIAPKTLNVNFNLNFKD